MKNFKEIADKCLNGELSGTFIIYHQIFTKDDEEILEVPSKNLIIDKLIPSYPYLFKSEGVNNTSCQFIANFNGSGINRLRNYKIINFIPDMKESELTIEIPNNKVVDWDESKKQNRIILKDKQLTYKDICEKLFKYKEFFFTNNTGVIQSSSPTSKEYLANAANNSTSYHQLECILAKNMLANVAKYLNNGWKPSGYIFGYFICVCGEELEIRNRNDYKFNNNIIFKTKELAQQAIEILGKETVKLALEPLGI